jgi:tetratricopeptide (TPR) repeat protein
MRQFGLMRGRTVWPACVAVAIALALCLNGVALSQEPTAPEAPPKAAPKSGVADTPEEAFNLAKRYEQSGEFPQALEHYDIVLQNWPTSEWATLARERMQIIARHMSADAELSAAGPPGPSLGGILLSLFGSCFSLLFLLSWVLFFAYRGGWLWQSTIGARIGDPISGFVERFRSRKKLSRELEARKLNPRDARSRHNLGVIYYQGRKYEQALDELAESVSIDPDRTDAQYFLGLTLLKLNRPAEAIEPLERVVAVKPRHGGDALVRLAEAKLAVGDLAEAERLALQAAHGAPTDAEARYMLAVVLDANGKPEEVPRLLQEAIQLGRSHRGARRREALTVARRAQAYVRSRKR